MIIHHSQEPSITDRTSRLLQMFCSRYVLMKNLSVICEALLPIFFKLLISILCEDMLIIFQSSFESLCQDDDER